MCVCGGGGVEGKKDGGEGRGVEREEGGRERRRGKREKRGMWGIGERDVYVWRKMGDLHKQREHTTAGSIITTVICFKIKPKQK